MTVRVSTSIIVSITVIIVLLLTLCAFVAADCKTGYVEFSSGLFGRNHYQGPRDLYIVPDTSSASLPSVTCYIRCNTMRYGPINPPRSTAFWYFNNTPVQDNPLFRIERHYYDLQFRLPMELPIAYTRKLHWPTTITQSMIGAYECGFRKGGILYQKNTLTLHVAGE